MLPDGVIARLHEQRPAITEDLLSTARDAPGRTPYQWLAELLPADGPVLDLACGSAPMADLVGFARYLGIDRSDAELGEARRRRPGVRCLHGDVLTTRVDGGPFVALCVSMALMLLPLEAVLARAAGWLRPGGVLAAIVPSRDRGLAGTPYGRLLASLQLAAEPFPEPLDRLPERCAAHGLSVHADELALFDVPINQPADRELLLGSFYIGRGVSPGGAADVLDEHLATGARTLGYPVRRLHLVRCR